MTKLNSSLHPTQPVPVERLKVLKDLTGKSASMLKSMGAFLGCKTAPKKIFCIRNRQSFYNPHVIPSPSEYRNLLQNLSINNSRLESQNSDSKSNYYRSIKSKNNDYANLYKNHKDIKKNDGICPVKSVMGNPSTYSHIHEAYMFKSSYKNFLSCLDRLSSRQTLKSKSKKKRKAFITGYINADDRSSIGSLLETTHNIHLTSKITDADIILYGKDILDSANCNADEKLNSLGFYQIVGSRPVYSTDTSSAGKSAHVTIPGNTLSYIVGQNQNDFKKIHDFDSSKTGKDVYSATITNKFSDPSTHNHFYKYNRSFITPALHTKTDKEMIHLHLDDDVNLEEFEESVMSEGLYAFRSVHLPSAYTDLNHSSFINSKTLKKFTKTEKTGGMIVLTPIMFDILNKALEGEVTIMNLEHVQHFLNPDNIVDTKDYCDTIIKMFESDQESSELALSILSQINIEKSNIYYLWKIFTHNTARYIIYHATSVKKSSYRIPTEDSKLPNYILLSTVLKQSNFTHLTNLNLPQFIDYLIRNNKFTKEIYDSCKEDLSDYVNLKIQRVVNNLPIEISYEMSLNEKFKSYAKEPNAVRHVRND